MNEFSGENSDIVSGIDTIGESEYGLPASLKAFRAAVAVAHFGSAARASSGVNRSATAITRDVQMLEASFGLALFERHTRGMAPTPAGRVVVARGARAFDELERGDREVRAVGGSVDPQRDDRQGSRLARLVSGRLLYVLIAVADAKSVTHAAERLSLSQPAVSQAIRELEHLAGAKLVDRTSRGVRMTEAGEMLLRRFKLALMELRVATEEVASMHGVLRGQVTIASLPYSSVELVPRAVTEFLKLHSEIKVTIVDGTYDLLIDQLRNADIDIIISALRPSGFDDTEQERLFNDTLCVVCRINHPYARLEHVELRDVVRGSWVVPLPGTVTRESFEAAFRAEGLDPPIVQLQVHNPQVVRTILMQSDHLALLSAAQIRSEVSAGQLKALPIQLASTQRSIGLTMRRDGSPSPSVKALRDELRAASRVIARSLAASP